MQRYEVAMAVLRPIASMLCELSKAKFETALGWLHRIEGQARTGSWEASVVMDTADNDVDDVEPQDDAATSHHVVTVSAVVHAIADSQHVADAATSLTSPLLATKLVHRHAFDYLCTHIESKLIQKKQIE